MSAPTPYVPFIDGSTGAVAARCECRTTCRTRTPRSSSAWVLHRDELFVAFNVQPQQQP
jgi:hypothetical protein